MDDRQDFIGMVLQILRGALSVEVTTDIPPDRPGRLVMVALDGDNSTPFVLRPRIGLTCWGESDRDAMGIALDAVAALQDAALDHDLLSAAELESMSRDEWLRNGQGRYYALVNLTINTDE